jgi:hypothetical protein
MAKVKIGFDENILDLLSIGNVKKIVRHPIKTYTRKKLPGHETLIPSLGSAETLYVVEGLVDSDVDENLQKLLNLYHSQKPVWLETDSFTVAGKITDLEFPYDAGQLWRRYRLELTEVPFWGTTIINESEETYLCDLDFQSKAKQIVPTFGRHNFQLDRTNKKFSYEFLLVNELEETENFNVLWDDDQTSFWSVSASGTGSLTAPTLSDVASPSKRGNNCLKTVVGDGGTYGVAILYHNYNPSQDWSSYDFLAFWLYGANTGTTIQLWLRDTNINWSRYDIVDDWTGWKRIVIPLRNPDGYYGSDYTDLSIINRIQIEFRSSGTWYIDRGGVDNWTKIEIRIPDTLISSDYYIQVYQWNVEANSYSLVCRWNDYAQSFGFPYFLDGSLGSDFYGSSLIRNSHGDYFQGQKGETKSGWFVASAGSITYSLSYGCKQRIGYTIKMPPWTGSDDLSGKFAINKAKIKIEIYYDKEKTTYIDGSLQT